MPSGQVHRKATLALAPIAGLTAAYVAGMFGQQTGLPDGLRAGLACVLGVLMTLAVSPDLDLLESSFNSKMRHKKKFLPWWILWYPYSISIPHRHPLSHFPLLGTFIRLIYLLSVVCLGVAILLFFDVISVDFLLYIIPPRWAILWLVTGMAVSDIAHWFMDIS